MDKEKEYSVKTKMKFYGYRAAKSAEDKRISRLKRACGCRNNSILFRFALKKLEEIFLPTASAKAEK
jgi:hypothetical protein